MDEEKLLSERGFLPGSDPLEALPTAYRVWDHLGAELPKLLLSSQFHKIFDQMSVLSIENLITNEQLERAMLLLSFFGHAYVFGQEIKQKIPQSIAIPWFQISQKLDRLPILSYASYALNNWKRLDKKREVALGNIGLLQNFLGGIDEDWFVIVHVDIEMRAALALKKFNLVQQATKDEKIDLVLSLLRQIENSLEQMCCTLKRMPEKCDPYIYYNRVRPYIHGWKDNPALPNGILYEGVVAYCNQPQQFRGETGAQSSIIPSFDALFGIQHQADPLRHYLIEMRRYMPIAHRKFIEKVEHDGSVRSFILKHYHEYPDLKDVYNNCLQTISTFRSTHLHYAAQYIQKQSQTSSANSTVIGTGGTPFMRYLKKHKDETLNFLIKST